MSADTTKPIKISVIVPAHNATSTLAACLRAVEQTTHPLYECIVVDDCSTDDSAVIAGQFAARVVSLKGGPFGPAHARNEGARVATGEILFFIDADVVVRPDTLGEVAETFSSRPHIDALFGSYDEEPGGTKFLTQYKNLIHHFVHQRGQEEAATFWSGCGAIRREVFLEMGGFDQDRYPQPSIEDIELGYRLRAAGHHIYLNKRLQVKHLKQWTLKGLIKTDVINRALPWTRLIMRAKNLPNDLNLQASQRVSALLLCLLLLFLAVNAFQENIALLPLFVVLFLLLVDGWHWRQAPAFFRMTWQVELSTYVLVGAIAYLAFRGQLPELALLSAVLFPLVLAGRFVPQSKPTLEKLLFAAMMLVLAAGFVALILSYPVWLSIPVILTLGVIVWLNRQLYAFFARKRGLVFALAALPLQLFYYFYSVVTFMVSGGLHVWSNRLSTK